MATYGLTTNASNSTMLSFDICLIKFIIYFEILSFLEATHWTVKKFSLKTMKAKFPLTRELNTRPLIKICISNWDSSICEKFIHSFFEDGNVGQALNSPYKFYE